MEMPNTLRIREFHEFEPNTMVIVAPLTQSIDVKSITVFMPIIPPRDSQGTILRITTSNKISYYGVEGAIISCTSSLGKRGLRQGGGSTKMKNMAGCDIQIDMKNVHIKITSQRLNLLGIKSEEGARRAVTCLLDHIKMFNDNIKSFKSLPLDKINASFDWMFKNMVIPKYDKKGNYLGNRLVYLKDEKYTELVSNADPACLNLINFLTSLGEEFNEDETDKFYEKCKQFYDFITSPCTIFDGELNYSTLKVPNSVYLFNLDIQDISLIKLALFLKFKKEPVIFHNWFATYVNLVYMIKKEGKVYFHRFTITDKGSFKQCSPSFREESYERYLHVMELLREFFEDNWTYRRIADISFLIDQMDESDDELDSCDEPCELGVDPETVDMDID